MLSRSVIWRSTFFLFFGLTACAASPDTESVGESDAEGGHSSSSHMGGAVANGGSGGDGANPEVGGASGAAVPDAGGAADARTAPDGGVEPGNRSKGIWVAVGYSGIRIRSLNGRQWIDAKIRGGGGDDPNNLRGLAFGNGLFVAVGGGGGAGPGGRWSSVSANGKDWRDTIMDGGWMGGVAFGKGMFVAGATAGEVFTSPNGFDWTRQAARAQGNIRGMAFGSDVFVATGDNGTFWSTDLRNWNVAANVGSYDGVDFVQGRFVVYRSDGTVTTSSDGKTWSASMNLSGTYVLGAAALPGGRILLGSNFHCWVSTDLGRSWGKIAEGNCAGPIDFGLNLVAGFRSPSPLWAPVGAVDGTWGTGTAQGKPSINKVVFGPGVNP
ncbi:MAG: hypothetical protein SF187_26740 [Deltaproteobacteria bacterium]|nr:hypothetical protein [Deltaproteobacteria bacterium]